MSRLLQTVEISFKIEEIIKSTNAYLLLVSPYLQIHERLKSILKNTLVNEKVKIYIVTRQDSKKDIEWLESYKNVTVDYVSTLHSKYYLNETEALITSMNLYHYSMVNNYEIGVSIMAKDELNNYELLLQDYSIMTGKVGFMHKLRALAIQNDPAHKEAIAKAKKLAANSVSLSQIKSINFDDLVS